jgi:hypothetical protein
MEQLRALRQAEGRLSLVGDHISVLSGKLEDLLFRAQRIAHALKDNAKAKVTDAMFGYDLQNFRRDVRAFGNDAGGISSALGSIERSAQYDEPSLVHAQAVMRLCDRIFKGLSALLDKAVLAHQHIREAEHKVEAWYMVQEIESLAQQTQGLPGLANKVLVAVSARKGAPAALPMTSGALPSAPGRQGGGTSVPPPAAAPVLQRRAAVPLRLVGRLVSSPSVSPPT